LWLGRSYLVAGDTTRARIAYGDFFTRGLARTATFRSSERRAVNIYG
jgi:hypothetical protein